MKATFRFIKTRAASENDIERKSKARSASSSDAGAPRNALSSSMQS